MAANVTAADAHAAGRAGGARPPRSGGPPGDPLFDTPPRSAAELNDALGEGLPFHTLAALREYTGLPAEAVRQVMGVSERTLSRRKREGRFTGAESARLHRLRTVFDRAAVFFEGDRAAAARWLTSPAPYFRGHTPLSFVESEAGAGEVTDLIGRLEWGVLT